MSDLDKKLEEIRSYFAEFFGRPLTDDEFNNIPAVKKLKKNTPTDVQNSNTENDFSTTEENFQAPNPEKGNSADVSKVDDVKVHIHNYHIPTDKEIQPKKVETPKNIEIEAEILGAMLLKKGACIPDVMAVVNAEDFSSPVTQTVFRTIVRQYKSGITPDLLSLYDELKGQVPKDTLVAISNSTFTTAYAQDHATIIKRKSVQRQLIQFFKLGYEDAVRPNADLNSILLEVESELRRINGDFNTTQEFKQHIYFAELFEKHIEEARPYCERKTGFANIDEQQIFSPGLYVIGATPACGKTTFAWQLLGQLASNGETCIFCSYEMSSFEMYSKTFARELFKKEPSTTLTAADIRRGGYSNDCDVILGKLISNINGVDLIELRDENIDELLRILKPRCKAKGKAPVVCIDYLQIIPPANDRRLITDKAKIDDIVRKLKTFQRETNTTFIVISSFNRMNYYQQVSFESFKESGNIEYSADVVWALQLNVVNTLNLTGDKSPIREKIEEAKRLRPREIELKCLKNRQGNNYDCYFNYFSAHDYFEPLDDAPAPDLPESDNSSQTADDGDANF